MRDVFGTQPTVREIGKEVAEEYQVARTGDRGFGPLVHVLRLDLEIAQGSMAAKLRVPAAFLADVENGKTRANAEVVRMLSVELDVSFAWLFDVWDREAPGTEDRMTVAEAKGMVRRLLSVGVECPCCGRPAKEQRRSLTPLMVDFMRWLVGQYRGEPVLITPWAKDHVQYGGDYAKVAHWDLAKREPGKLRLWSPTTAGRKFVKGQTKVQRTAVLWRNEVIRMEGKLLDIHQLAGDEGERPERTGERTPALPGMGPA